MSRLIEQEIACPACKHPTEAELWSSINVKEDPELKDLLLGGEINIVKCGACREVFYAESFVLYHDPANELMAMVYPSDQREMADLLMEKTRADFHVSQEQAVEGEQIDYEPACLFGLDELLRLVESVEEESLQSEVAQAVARERGITVRSLRPSVARAQGLPRLLPVDESKPEGRDAVIAGLAKLKSANDLLTVYNAALDRLAADPSRTVRLS